ncbi:unnamed protein product [Acanthoscelides obtectus]|uniref:HTH CENPB-type domain-containing protein n=1 Tax=Acanthoscelides obtectus TaxID=200917 RepID=A0A9P0KVD7_ACAOB|nr:unnamed protein product [Acanthoscelides obtectus]CAK1678349.1 hypothetical protein AOBTE_LOCUS31834 [Acanthoscelides obtectus]
MKHHCNSRQYTAVQQVTAYFLSAESQCCASMPTKYKCTGSCSRASWTEQQLAEAIQAVNENRMGVNEAGRNFGVPATTLRRRKLRENVKKGPLGPSSTLGEAAEEKLTKYIIKLQKNGFSPTRTDVRSMDFKLAEELSIKHNFNKELRLAGFPWLQLFLQRNSRLSVRKAEGVSIDRSLGMNKKDIEAYFQLLENTLIGNDLMNKPGHIYNMDETGLQLNNRPGHVIVKKGSKNIASISSGEKGETITWLKDQFVPRKPTGVVLLLLDGHASHCNNVDMLEYCVEHNITLLCLPSHTTQFLQPLDRCFFRSLKLNYYSACNLYIKNNPGRKLTRLQFGKLLAEGWNKSATVNNGASAFKATGIMPFNPSAIQDDAYLTEINIVLQAPHAGKNKQIPEDSSQSFNKALSHDDQQPCCSWQTEDDSVPEKQNESVVETNANTPVKSTPGKMLDIISPVPVVSADVNSVRKRSKQLAEILTTETTIGEKRTQRLEKTEKERKVKTRKLKPVLKKPKVTKKKTRKAAKSDSSSDEGLEAPTLDDSSDDMDDDDQTCTGCGEIYSQTTKSDDWVNCIGCSKWFHDSCSKFVNFCHDCGVVICKTK